MRLARKFIRYVLAKQVVSLVESEGWGLVEKKSTSTSQSIIS